MPGEARWSGILAVTLGAALLPGCSILAPSTDRVTVNATDPAAVLYADGQSIGTGSAVATVRSNEKHVFTAVLGNRKAQASTNYRLSGVGGVDAICGFVLLVPWIGLATGGAWNVEPDSVLLVLPPE